MPGRQTRRQYLLAVGAVGTATLAGCSESGTDPDSGEAGTDEQTDGTEAEPTAGADSDDETPAESDTEDSGQTNRLEVISAVGRVDGSAISQVEVTVKTAPGAGDVDLSGTEIQFVHSSGSTDLSFASTGGSATAFGVGTIQDEDGSLEGASPTLNDPADRAQLRLDTSSIVTNGLEPGDSATVRITTESGGTTELRLVVPQTLGDARAVAL